MKILIGIIVSAAALGVAAWVVPGIVIAGHSDASKAETLLAVAVIFGVINAVLKPVIKTVVCAFYVLTVGLVEAVVEVLRDEPCAANRSHNAGDLVVDR